MTNPSTLCATVIVDELVRGGLRDLVLCPGSRSAPLAYAAAAAARRGELRLHVRVDERSAGFLALGLARGSRRATAVVTTSGTAVANLHPAVVEADHSGVPLVVVSANRPAELVGTGANQTIDQVGIFGSAVRYLAAIPAGLGKSANATWRSRVCRVLAAAEGLGGDAGPVQLDVAFADPLVPSTDVDPLSLYPGRDGPWTETSGTDADLMSVRAGGRTLVVVGPGRGRLTRSAVSSAVAAGLPCHVEAGVLDGRTDGTLRAGAWLLDDAGFLDRHRPDRLIVVGRPTLGRGLGRLASRPDVDVHVVDHRSQWPDPTSTALSFRRAGELCLAGEADGAWAEAWRRSDDAAAAAVRDRIAGSDGLSGPHVARVVAEEVSGPLVVGSSNPIRDLDLFAERWPGPVHANRGASGIDGTVSTAVGVALDEEERPTTVLLGDLAFLHDANGLLLGPDEPRPDLTLVVVNNDGGAIFGLLEHGEPAYAADHERLFGTPLGVDLAALCAATRTPHRRVSTAAELVEALRAPASGIRVVEARVDRFGERNRREQVRAAVRHAVATAR